MTNHKYGAGCPGVIAELEGDINHTCCIDPLKAVKLSMLTHNCQGRAQKKIIINRALMRRSIEEKLNIEVGYKATRCVGS